MAFLLFTLALWGLFMLGYQVTGIVIDAAALIRDTNETLGEVTVSYWMPPLGSMGNPPEACIGKVVDRP